MGNLFIIAALAAGTFFLTKKPKASSKDSFDIPDLSPFDEEPTGIDPGQSYTPDNYTPPAATPASQSSATPEISTVNNKMTDKFISAFGGKFSIYNSKYADSKHYIKVKAISTVGASDISELLAVNTFKNIPAGIIIGKFAGMIYTAKSGSKYIVAYGSIFKKYLNKTFGVIYLIPLSKATITTNTSGKRIVAKNLAQGEYSIA